MALKKKKRTKKKRKAAKLYAQDIGLKHFTNTALLPIPKMQPNEGKEPKGLRG
jgi:hypothetical protein